MSDALRDRGRAWSTLPPFFPASVNGWQRWTFWQFTNNASVSGIPGTADMDEDRFNGTAAELHAYGTELARARSVLDVERVATAAT